MRGVTKTNLPTKLCSTCRLPFSWRKKWAKDWDSVRYCSERCRYHRAHSIAPSSPRPRR